MPDLDTLFADGVQSLARTDRVRHAIERSPAAREVLARFIAGATAFQALRAARDLQETGRAVTISYLGPEGDDAAADATVTELVGLVDVAHATGRTADGGLDLSVRPRTLGDLDAQPGSADHARLVERARTLCRAADAAGVSITLDTEGPETVEPTLALADDLRADFPGVGVTVQAALARTQDDCRTLADQGARVRLCKGAYDPAGGGVGGRHDVDLAFVRCLRTLLGGAGHVMVATHDARLVDITDALARCLGRERGTYEYQMYLGVRPLGQTALADRGDSCRVYVPYGRSWYRYLVSRLAEQPRTTAGLLRSVLRRH